MYLLPSELKLHSQLRSFHVCYESYTRLSLPRALANPRQHVTVPSRNVPFLHTSKTCPLVKYCHRSVNNCIRLSSAPLFGFLSRIQLLTGLKVVGVGVALILIKAGAQTMSGARCSSPPLTRINKRHRERVYVC